MPDTYRFLHVLFAFAWFAAVFAAHWNTLRARRTPDWSARAALFDANRAMSAMVGLPALLALGVVGNLYGMQMGYSMKTTFSFMLANGLWTLVVLATLVVEIPAAGALGALSHAGAQAAAQGAPAEPAGWGRELGRWRAANAVQLLGFLVLLALMIAPWTKAN
jgi:hypothetical protein